jgi:hypothetical protein
MHKECAYVSPPVFRHAQRKVFGHTKALFCGIISDEALKISFNVVGRLMYGAKESGWNKLNVIKSLLHDTPISIQV